MSLIIIRAVDFETTGLPPEGDLAKDAAKRLGAYPAIVEIGWCDLCVSPNSASADWLVDVPVSHLVNPGKAIPPEASAIHHITDDDVKGSPDRTAIRPLLVGKAAVFAAHNAAFEQAFFTGAGLPWICTLKAARRVWPNAPSHSNQALRYWLGLKTDSSLASPAHRAGPDAYVTALLLRRLFESGATLEQMLEWTTLPSLLPQVTFGKHRGKSWSELPLDYLEWLANKSDMDVDTKFTAKHWIDAQ